MKRLSVTAPIVLSALALASCKAESPPKRPESSHQMRDKGRRSYFLASLVQFGGASPCPFKVNAITPFCVRLAAPPFAKRRGGVSVIRTPERCDANIAGISCDGLHLLFDSTTLDTIWGLKRFAAGGAFLIDQLASGKGDWIYRLYDGDGYNMRVTCIYPARENGISDKVGQLSDAEVDRLCRGDAPIGNDS